MPPSAMDQQKSSEPQSSAAASPEHLSHSDLRIVVNCLERQMTPFSPQPANRQAQLLTKYIRIVQRHMNAEGALRSIIGPKGFVLLDWLQPFVDAQRTVTFAGFALSRQAYGGDGNAIQQFTDPEENSASSAHPVFPSTPANLLVWDELQRLLGETAQKELPTNRLHHLIGNSAFCNWYTPNSKPTVLFAGEPFIVRIGLRNPFPFPLVLQNVHLSVDQCRPESTENVCYAHKIVELKLPAHAEGGKIGEESEQNDNLVEVDLEVLPSGAGVESFQINGVNFDLCSPTPGERDHPVLTIPAFVSISVRGRRLFKTKEQRTSKMYASDNRLRAVVSPESAPLLSFRPIGGEQSMIRAISRNLAVDAYTDQILQIAFEMHNTGPMSIQHLRFGTNLPGQVAISEPHPSADGVNRWIPCAAKSQHGSQFMLDDPYLAEEMHIEQVGLGRIGAIAPENPLNIGAKTTLRVSLRVGAKPQLFYFLFLYIGQNGCPRQFRFAIRTRPLADIFAASLQPLNASLGLQMLRLKCPSQSATDHSPMFSKLEVLRLAARFATTEQQPSATASHCAIRRLDAKPILLENGASQNFCFYATSEEKGETGRNSDGWTDLWLGQTYIPDIPRWHTPFRPLESQKNLDPREQQSRDASDFLENSTSTGEEKEDLGLQLRLLWKASIARADGTVNTMFGELLV